MATPTKPRRRATAVAGAARAARGSALYLDDRLPFARWLRPQLRKLFPSHWSFLLGELALYSFVFLLLTGAFLTLFFKPNPDVAFASVREISLEVRGGLLMRQLHHWSATVFVLSIVAHLCRVFFTGAFRKPRELTWLLGVVLFVMVLANSFIGVSMLGDQLAFSGLREAQGLLLSVPLIGTYLSAFGFGGAFPGDAVPRLFLTHVILIPGILLAAVPLHALILTWRQKHTERKATATAEDKVTGGPFFPYFAIKNGATALFTMGAITLLATLVRVNPVWEHGAYTPGAAPPSAQPFWYYGVLDGALRLTPAWEIPVGGYVLQVGLWIPMAVLTAFFLVLLAYPFLERRRTGDTGHHQLLDRPSDAPVRTGLGVAVLTFFTVLWAGTWVSAAPPAVTAAPGPAAPPPAPAALLTVPAGTYQAVIVGLRVAVFVLPVVAFLLTRALCRRRGPAGGLRPGRLRARRLRPPAAPAAGNGEGRPPCGERPCVRRATCGGISR
ncbi:cytochrome b N-terminal domain-containing protein [Actinomadura sp. ATCC 31491]|uniref:Cytochrome bc1 complex cytochrome b subunit n=1 Tax=Actinomadura luzonensis TaxID=2805427 RepID=A0ABT0G5X9_9ACTN|nr:cytochrome b N-terminal domain-containing protein [Actinomadura luzonensis]MCK2220022.1 cytochrome b N-terminal domain-containing protein [Actinomadura luzonensis]